MRRARRILLWAFGVVAAVILVAVVGLVLLLGDLGSDMVAPRLTAALQDALGVDVDYEAGAIDVLAGQVRLEGLSVATPGAYAVYAPTLLSLERLEAELDLWGAVVGGDIDLSRVGLDGLALTVVVGPDGDSLSALVPGDEGPDEGEAAPLASSLDTLRTALAGVRLGALRIDDVTLTYVVVDEGGRVRSRTTLTPVSLTGRLAPDGSDPWLEATLSPTGGEAARLIVTSGPSEAPAQEAGSRSMAVPFEIAARVGAGDVALDAQVGLRDHGVAALRRDPARGVLDTVIRFAPEDGETRLHVRRLDLLDGALEIADLRATIADEAPGSLRALSGRLSVTFEGASPLTLPGVDARDGHLTFELADAHASSEAFAGDGSLEGTLGALDVTVGGARTAARGMRIAMRARGGATSADGATAGVGRLTLDLSADRLELDGPTQDTRLGADDLRFDWTSTDLARGGDGPFGLHGRATASVSMGHLGGRITGLGVDGQGLGVSVGAAFDEGSVEGELPVERLVVRGAGGARLLEIAGTVLRGGTDTPLGWSPGAEGSARGRLTGGIGRVVAGGVTASVPRLSVDLRREAGSAAYGVDADLGLGRVRGVGVDLDGRRRLTLAARGNLDRLDAAVELGLAGARGPDLDAALEARVERATDALTFVFRGDARRLGAALAAALPGGVEATLGRLRLDGEGRVLGVVQTAAGRSLPALVAADLADLRGAQRWSVDLENVGGSMAADTPGGLPTSAKIPELSLRVELDHGQDATGVALAADAEHIDAVVPGGGSIDVDGWSQRVEGTIPHDTLGTPWRLSSTTRLRRGELPGLVPGLPVADTELTFDAELGPETTTVTQGMLVNPPTATRLTFELTHERALGAADLAVVDRVVPGRTALVVEGEITQDVAALVDTGLVREASGTLRVPFRVASGDLVAYRVEATPTAQGVTVVDGVGGLEVNGFSGVIPVVEDVAVLSDRIEIGYGTPVNALARARFFDVHPFLGGDAFVSADRVRIGGEVIGPLAGNVRIAGTVFAIDRLQAGYRGGTVAGQLLVDLRRRGGVVSFRGNVTGVHPGGGGRAAPGDDGEEDGDGDVLDANGAFLFRPETLALDGTVNVVRISRAHLDEMLDVIDPYHESVSANRIRSLLGLGYPSFLRLRAHDGLLDVAVELGGLASFVRIDEITAIPLAPLLEQYAAPTVEALFPEPPGSAEAAAPANTPPVRKPADASSEGRP